MRIHLVVLLVSFAVLPAMGAEQSSPGAGPRTPPPEAIAACNGKHEGDSVSFASPRGDTINGTCKLLQTRLVAVPRQPPRRNDDDKRTPNGR